MAKSSRYMQALFGVIAGGTRRKPVYIRQQALVSKLYPYFFEDTFTVNMPQTVLAAVKDIPHLKDGFIIATPTVSSIVMQEPILNRSYPDEDYFEINLPTASAISMQSLTIQRSFPDEDHFKVTPSVKAITISDVVIRSNYRDEDYFAVDLPAVSNIILEG